jgi:hypothetical protein
MSKRTVNKNVQAQQESLGWDGALADAEQNLAKAESEVQQWETVVRVCRKKIEQRAPWPGSQSSGQSKAQQHSA